MEALVNRKYFRRLSKSISTCVTNGLHYGDRVTVTEPNFFITNDDGCSDNDHHLNDKSTHQVEEFDPSALLDHWLRELDSANMVSMINL